MPINIQVPQLALEGYLKRKQLQQEYERAQQLHDQAQEQLKELHEHNKDQLKIQQQHLDLQKSLTAQHLKQQLMENLASGLESAPQSSNQGMPQIPPSENMAPPSETGDETRVQPTISTAGKPVPMQLGEDWQGGLGKYLDASQRTITPPSPESMAQHQANVMGILGPALGKFEGQKAGGVAQGQLDVASSPQARQLRLDNFNEEMKKIAAMGKNQEDVANINGHYRLLEAYSNNATHLAGIRLANQMLLNPDLIETEVNKLMSGQGTYKDIPNPKVKMAVDLAFNSIKDPQTGQPYITPGPDVEKRIEGLRAVENYIAQAREIAHTYSRDKPEGGVISGWAATKGFPGPLERRLTALESQAGISTGYFDKGVRVYKELVKLQVKGLFNPLATEKQNLDAIDSHARTLNNSIDEVFTGMPPSQISELLAKHGIHEFGNIKTSTPIKDATTRGKFSIKTDDGKERFFETQAQLDKFKKLAGIK